MTWEWNFVGKLIANLSYMREKGSPTLREDHEQRHGGDQQSMAPGFHMMV